MKELEYSQAIERLEIAIEEANTAIQLLKSGQPRESIKHIDESKDRTIASIFLVLAELEGGE